MATAQNNFDTLNDVKMVSCGPYAGRYLVSNSRLSSDLTRWGNGTGKNFSADN